MRINEEIREIIRRGVEFKDILGLDKAKEEVKSALFAGHHIILIGPPGVGKTTLALNIAKILPPTEIYDCPFHCSVENPQCEFCKAGKSKKIVIEGEERFVRIQGSPDLSEEDLFGDIDPAKALKYGPTSIKAFSPGKIFKANKKILFFDEINRCPQKLQNALLQVLSEKKVTIGSYDVDIESDFILIGTMNPQDKNTESLSDVFLDRVDFIRIGYPESKEIEYKIVVKNGLKEKKFDETLAKAMIEFVRELRIHPDVESGPSVRASISLYNRAIANAVLKGRDKVEWDDIRTALISVLAHRIRLKPSVEFKTTPEEFLKNSLERFWQKKKKKEGDVG